MRKAVRRIVNFGYPFWPIMLPLIYLTGIDILTPVYGKLAAFVIIGGGILAFVLLTHLSFSKGDA